MKTAHGAPKPRNLQQLTGPRWLEVSEREGADHAADIRSERDEAGE